jgi:plasmid stabilization system protein ParE
MYSILWSATAHDTYISILEFLNEIWGIDKAYDFDAKTFQLLTSLSSFKNLCPPSKYNSTFRKCSLNKYTALVYRIDENSKQIELTTFLDNRMDNVL